MVARNYAESFARPFLRRADTMARPARVCIRARKPCLRARRRLFGWKVRLDTVDSLCGHERPTARQSLPGFWPFQD